MRRRGNFVIVPIHNTSGTTSWMVRGTKMNGERVCPTFKTEAEALAEKQRLENEAANTQAPKGEITYVLKEHQLRDAERAIALLRHGTLSDAASYYDTHHVPIKTDKTLAEAYPLYLAESQHLRQSTLGEYNGSLKLLVDARSCMLMNDMTADLLKGFLKGSDPIPGHPQISRPWSASRQRFLLRVFSPFFSWGVNEGYCARNPVKQVKVKPVLTDEVEPAILGLSHLQQLLDVSWAYCGGRYAAYVVLATWAALRPTETRGLQVSAIDLDEGWVKVSGKVAKTRSRRMIELMPNTLMMLRDLRDRDLLINEALNPSEQCWTTIRALAGLAGSKRKIPRWCFLPQKDRWRKEHRAIELSAPCQRSELVEYVNDVLRHSGISHHLAWFSDENLTAGWAGNSPAIIHKHYKGLVTTLESQTFWTMLPTALKQAGKQVSPPEGGHVRRVSAS